MPVLLVNGEAIEDTALQRETAAMLALMAQRMEGEDPLVLRSRAQEWAEENLIEAALLRQAALSDPETRSPEPGDSPESEAQLRVGRLVAKITAQASPPRRKNVIEFYAKNRDAFQEPEQLRVAHIVRNVDELNSEAAARAAIEKARDELASGRPFGQVADEMSDCPGRGGELDPFSRGEMVPAFEDVVFQLGVNQVSGIFRTDFGFHIATLLERKPAAVRTLAQVQDQIGMHLQEDKQQKKLHQYLDHLRARAVIQKSTKPVE